MRQGDTVAFIQYLLIEYSSGLGFPHSQLVSEGKNLKKGNPRH
jgi:hypothetical protein